jgi:hypothetical protein
MTTPNQTPAATPGSLEPVGSEQLLEWAWSIIANAGGGNWKLESPEWQGAAAKWRDEYHKHLHAPNDKVRNGGPDATK